MLNNRQALLFTATFAMFGMMTSGCALSSEPETQPSESDIGTSQQSLHSSERKVKGNISATEVFAETPSGPATTFQHTLTGSGHATVIGPFTYSATVLVDTESGDAAGTAVWTARDHSSFTTSQTGGVTGLEYPLLFLTETQVITSGTGRFRGATGTIVINRQLNLETGATSGTLTGGVDTSH